MVKILAKVKKEYWSDKTLDQKLCGFTFIMWLLIGTLLFIFQRKVFIMGIKHCYDPFPLLKVLSNSFS